MASFHTKTFSTHDDYMTPMSAWEDIMEYIPKDKVIWEAFYGNGESANNLKKLGFTVVSHDEDFFENDRGDIVITNPPFTKVKEVVNRLKQLNKPFIMIMPSSKINTSYIREAFKDDILQIIIPRRRIQFHKLVDGEVKITNRCNFDCLYYCWKMGFEKDINWLK